MQMVCALVKPTIMARKMVRASRGIDPKRPAEPRRAESRHDREAARAHIVSGRRREGSKIAEASSHAAKAERDEAEESELAFRRSESPTEISNRTVSGFEPVGLRI